MKASSIKLKTIIENTIVGMVTDGHNPDAGWCGDMIPLKMTVEEWLNLKALATRFGDIKPTELELDSVKI